MHGLCRARTQSAAALHLSSRDLSKVALQHSIGGLSYNQFGRMQLEAYGSSRNLAKPSVS